MSGVPPTALRDQVRTYMTEVISEHMSKLGSQPKYGQLTLEGLPAQHQCAQVSLTNNGVDQGQNTRPQAFYIDMIDMTGDSSDDGNIEAGGAGVAETKMKWRS